MLLLTYIATMMTLIIMAMTIMLNIISKKAFNDREKSAPFECGFDPHSSSRMPFSLQFFMIAVIFLIFDVEITLLFPIIKTVKMSNVINLFVFSMSFLMILIIGTIHEWNQGALDWHI